MKNYSIKYMQFLKVSNIYQWNIVDFFLLKPMYLKLFNQNTFQQHIYTIRGRILETILSLRFFIFQYGVVYHMDASNDSTALLVC